MPSPVMANIDVPLMFCASIPPVDGSIIPVSVITYKMSWLGPPNVKLLNPFVFKLMELTKVDVLKTNTKQVSIQFSCLQKFT